MFGKKLFMSICLVSLVGTSSLQATCQKMYVDKLATSILPAKVKENGVPLAVGGYALGTTAYIIGGSALGLIGLPVAVISGIKATKTIRDKGLLNMIRIMDQAQYINGTKEKPSLSNEYKAFVSDQENENAIEENRAIKKFNNNLAKANKEILVELGKTERTFIKFYNSIAKEVPGLTVTELAKVVEEENNSENICNGVVGLSGKKVLETREDVIIELSEDKKERRKQKKHNRKVKRHNKKVEKQQKRTLLASKKELKDYILNKYSQE